MEQKKGKRSSSAARDVAYFAAALRRIVRAGHAEAGLVGIDLQIKGNPDEPGVAECTVDIHGDTQADAENIAKRFEDDGWTCQSSGEKDVRCTSPD